MNIKSLLSIMALAALTACGDGCIEPVVPVAVVAPVVMPEPTPEPVVVVPACTAGMPNCLPPEGMELCDLTSYIPCATPTWIPSPPKPEPVTYCSESTVVCAPSPTPAPIRNRI